MNALLISVLGFVAAYGTIFVVARWIHERRRK
jgi:hypothetical protein